MRDRNRWPAMIGGCVAAWAMLLAPFCAAELVLHIPGGANEASTKMPALVGPDAALVNAGNTSASIAVGPKLSLPQGTTLDGVNDYVACGNASWVAPTGPFTVGGWFYSANWKTGSSYGELVAKTNAVAANTPFELRVNYVAGTPEFVVYASGSLGSTAAADISSLNGQWVHIVGVYDGSFLRAYINGVASGTPAAKTGTPGTTTEVVTIGVRNPTSPSLPFAGRFADVRLYSHALTAGEVLAWQSETTPPSQAAMASLSTAVAGVSSGVAGVASDVDDVSADLTLVANGVEDVQGATDTFLPLPDETPPAAGSPAIGRQLVSGGYDRVIFFGDSQIQNMREVPVSFLSPRGGVRGYANAAGWYTANATFGALTATNDYADNSASQGSGKWAEITFLSLTSDASTTSTANRLLELARFGTPGGTTETQEADWSSHEQRWALGSNWMAAKLASGPLTVRMYYRKTPSGTTQANEYFVLKNGATVIATSGYVSTYAATATVAYVEATIPQGTTTPTQLNLEVRFRASTATETGKVSYWSARGECYDPAATSGTIVHLFASGGYSAATYSNTGLFSDAAASIITAINPGCVIYELGLNPTTDTPANYASSLTALSTRFRTFADSDVVYWAVPGRQPEDATFGGEGTEPPFVEGNYLAYLDTERAAFINSSRLMPDVQTMFGPGNGFIQWSGITSTELVYQGQVVEHSGTLYAAKTFHLGVGTAPSSDTTNWASLGAYTSGNYRAPKISDAQMTYDGIHVTRFGASVLMQSFIDGAHIVGWASGPATIAASVRSELTPELDRIDVTFSELPADVWIDALVPTAIREAIGLDEANLGELVAELPNLQEIALGLVIDDTGETTPAPGSVAALSQTATSGLNDEELANLTERILAARAFKPNPTLTWVLRRDADQGVGSTQVKRKKPTESLKFYADAKPLLSDGEAILVDSLEVEGSESIDVTVSEEALLNSMIEFRVAGGDPAEGEVGIHFETSLGQEVDATVPLTIGN